MKRLLALILLLSISQISHSQGLLFDDEEHSKIEEYDTEQHGFVANPPNSYSMKKYAPVPIAQTGGTCVSVSSSYSALTTAYNRMFNITGCLTSMNSFQPYFEYSNIKSTYDYYCENGTYIYKGLSFMKDFGNFKYATPFPISCNQSYKEDEFNYCLSLSAPYRIKSYSKISIENYSTLKEKAYQLKGVIAEGKPLVIGMMLPESFDNAFGVSLWDPSNSELARSTGHAMCVIGYDDSKYGGAFQIMNSWGTEFGDGGFIWIKYDDFFRYTKRVYSFELYSSTNTSCSYGNCTTGYGRYTWSSGETYEGQLNNNQMEGFGIYSNSCKWYAGFWSQGKRNGAGFLCDGTSVWNVKYSSGNIVSSEKFGFSSPEEDPRYDQIQEAFETIKSMGNYEEGDIDDLDDDVFEEIPDSLPMEVEK